MKNAQYNEVLRSLQIGAVKLPNRIVFGSHPTNFAKNNTLTKQHRAYYRERAKGGAGMIVLEEQVVHSSDLPYEKALFGYLESMVPEYRRIAEEVHKYGTVLVAQLNHSGMQSEGSTAMKELWAPSPVPDVVSREVPKAMEEEDIKEVIAGFVEAAGYTVMGELDGVEINASQFSLIRQFLSGLTNHRGDSYGGDLTGRLRFLKEVLQSVRETLGKDKILGVKLCGDEFAPWGGITPEEAVNIARELEKLELLDYLTVSVGSLYSLHLSMGTYYSDKGLSVDVASKVKEAVNLPVFAEGRIHQPEYAAQIIGQGLVDGVYMNRALICDPQLPNKLHRGEPDRIRTCISCNQGCQVRRAMGAPLSCVLNPLVGLEEREEMFGRKPAGRVKKVLVVGGGPGGMEAAITAASRGHKVTLWEAGLSLGGQMALNTAIQEISAVLQAWEKEMEEHNVQVVTGKECGPEDVKAELPDAVVLATGSKTKKPNGICENTLVISSLEVVKGSGNFGKTVLFWDEIGNQLMARAVEKLLDRGTKIYFVTPDLFVGNQLAATMELSTWNQRFMSAVAKIFTSSKVKSINGSEAVIENKFNGEILTVTGIDALVYNCAPKPNDQLYLALKNDVDEIYRVGDCLAPRGLKAAVREGFMVGYSI